MTSSSMPFLWRSIGIAAFRLSSATAVSNLIFVLALLTPALSQNFSGVLTQHNDNGRTGQNLQETILTPQNVNSSTFGKLFSYSVDGQIYAQPLYVPNVSIPGQGTHNVLYVVTQNDSLYAFDADGLQSTPLWQDSFINPAAGVTPVPCGTDGNTDISCGVWPVYGINSTPVIDPTTNTLYLVARTYENSAGVQRLHALDITTGAEKFGGPVVITASVPGTGADHTKGNIVNFDPLADVQRAGLLLLNGTVYIGWAGAYHGWIIGYTAQNSTETLTQVAAFNTTPNASIGGVWASGNGLAADPSGNIYAAVGDATFDANTGGVDYGDSLLKLSSTLQVLDYFAPMDQACRAVNDKDLGSAGPMLLPVQPGSVSDELIIAGKGGKPCDASGFSSIYLLNQNSLGEYNPNQDQVVEEILGSSGGYWSSPAYWQGPSGSYVYLAGAGATQSVGDYLKMYSLTNVQLSTTPVAQSTNQFTVGSTPSISANGSSDGIVWAVKRQDPLGTLSGVKPAILYAYNATNVSTMLYNSAQLPLRDQGGCGNKFQVPTIANGKVYVGTENEVDIFGLLPTNPTPAPGLNLSSPCEAFSTQAQGTTSNPVSVILTNSGNSPLEITSISMTGNNAADFSQTNNCTSLASGATCTITITFTPSLAKPETAYVTIVDNAAGSPHNIYLFGSGQAATVLTWSTPSPITYGTALSATQLDATANVPGTFVYTPAAGTVLSAGLQTLSVTFTPTNTTQYKAATTTVSLQVNQAPSTVVLSALATSIFPNQSTTLTAKVSITGSGAAPTQTVNFMLGSTLLGTGTLSPIDATDSTASLTLNSSQLALGANAITAVYSGDANYGGSTSSAITVTLLSAAGNFGSVNVGTPAPVQTLTYNFTTATTLSAVNILTTGASGLDYTDGGGSTCTAGTPYAANQSCAVTVAFTPSAPGLRSGAVTLFAQGSTLPLTTFYLSGAGQSSAVTIDPGTQSTITTLSNNGQAYGSVIDGAGNVYVLDGANSQVLELSAGSFKSSAVISSGLSNPSAVALDGAGNLYVSDTGNARVLRVPNEQGALNAADMSTVSISGLASPSGLATDGSGNLYVADATNGDVVEVPASGAAQLTLASGLTDPLSLAVDATGNLYVAGNNQVAEYPFGGGSPILIGSGYASPNAVAVDASGALYVADSGNARIVRVAAGGAPQSNLPITGLANPKDVALDAAGNVYVADSNSVYKLNRTQAAPLVFATTNAGSDSAPQTLTVSDAGNQTLTFSNLAVPTNFLQVASGGTDCASTTQLSSGKQCLVAIEFAPTASGVLAGTLTLSNNALNNSASSQTVQLSGTGAGGQSTQTITFPGIPNQTYGGPPLTLNASASSGLPVSYAVTSGPATVSGNLLTINGVGSVTVQASQSGNAEYEPATPVAQTFSVNPAGQTIAFTQNAPASAPYNGSFTVAASATSALPVSFSGSGSCTNVGATFTMTNSSGTCTITASQAGNGDYLAAQNVTESTTATKAAPTVTFTGAPATAQYQSTFTVVATTNSGVTATISPSGVCSINGTTVTMTSGTGTCGLTAKWVATKYFLAASATQSTTAAKQPSTITWNTPSPITYGTALSGTQLDPTANVAGSFIYSPSAGTVLTAGTHKLSTDFTATLSQDYAAASAQVSLVVNKTATTTIITSNSPNPSTVGQAVSVQFSVTPASGYGTPTGHVTVNASTGENCTATLTAGTGVCSLTFNSTGSRTLSASYAGDGNDSTSVSSAVTQTAN